MILIDLKTELDLFNREKIPAQCELCEKLYSIQKNRVKLNLSRNPNCKFQYCPECLIVIKAQSNIEVRCLFCNVSFVKMQSQIEKGNNHFCSKNCAASFNNKKSPKRKLSRICKIEECNCIVRNCRSTLCVTHWNNYKERKMGFANKTLGEYANLKKLGNKHRSSLFVSIRNFARNWLKHLLDLPCFNCGYNKHIELCHIKPISLFSSEALLSEINCENNVLPLCPNCHWEFDNELLDTNFIVNNWRGGTRTHKEL